MKRDSDRWRKTRGLNVVRAVAADERNATLLNKVGNIGMIARKSHGVRPRTQRSAPIPTTGVEQDHVTSRHFHALQFFQRFEVLTMDGCSGLDPSLRSRFPRQA